MINHQFGTLVKCQLVKVMIIIALVLKVTNGWHNIRQTLV